MLQWETDTRQGRKKNGEKNHVKWRKINRICEGSDKCSSIFWTLLSQPCHSKSVAAWPLFPVMTFSQLLQIISWIESPYLFWHKFRTPIHSGMCGEWGWHIDFQNPRCRFDQSFKRICCLHTEDMNILILASFYNALGFKVTVVQWCILSN